MQPEELNLAIKAALEGGAAILKFYEANNTEVSYKADNSPLTQADKAAHETIAGYLAQTGLPVLSEEGKATPYEERAQREAFWMVDPLDGTKEFINRNGEFTVNIARIVQGKTVQGVIYVPVLDVLYVGDVQAGAYKVEKASQLEAWGFAHVQAAGQKLPIEKPAGNKLCVVGSRSHMNQETLALIDEVKEGYEDVEILSRGSSLKFCMVAEGKAQFYPRIAPTMEWDTAAGHAIVKAMGGKVTIAGTEQEMTYNKEDLLNPHFVVEYGLR